MRRKLLSAGPTQGKDDEDDDPDRDHVACQHGAAEGGQDPDQTDVAGCRHEHLRDTPRRHPEQTQDDFQLDSYVRRGHLQPGASTESVELVQDPDSPSDHRGHGRACEAHLGKRADTEDEQGIEHDVDAVGDPDRSHRHRRVTCAPVDRVVHEQEQDHRHRTVNDPGVGRPQRDRSLVGSHQAQHIGRPDRARHAKQDRHSEAHPDRLRHPPVALPPRAGTTVRRTRRQGS